MGRDPQFLTLTLWKKVNVHAKNHKGAVASFFLQGNHRFSVVKRAYIFFEIIQFQNCRKKEMDRFVLFYFGHDITRNDRGDANIANSNDYC